MILSLLCLCATALAQGVSEWVSPGPLARAHAELEGITQCTRCHSPLQGVDPGLCTSCHERVGAEVRSGEGFHADKGTRCGTCHADHRGRDAALARVELAPVEHLRQTGFRLDGAHERIGCTQCHEPGDWAAAEPACDSCHKSPHGPTGHIELAPCDRCHSTTSWPVREVPASVFDHTDPRQTSYVLAGSHEDVGCLECHFEALFVPLAYEACTDCHADPHLGRFPGRCDSCHQGSGWVVPGFEHARTGFALEGLHAQVACDGCHQGSIPHPVRHETCADCHRDPHRGQFVPRTCDTCHTVTQLDFHIADYDHDQTAFPLAGHHEAVPCGDCHGQGPKAVYTPVEHEDCDACHEDVHAGRFEPTDCRSCHVESGWEVGEFDHDRTDFPLRGEHASVECAQCHPGEQWSGIEHDSCLRCHEGTQPHGTSLSPERCDGCHEETGFAQVQFAHAQETRFDLEPQHAQLPCTDCHELQDFAGLQTGCRPCHQDDAPLGHYEGACEGCHRVSAWLPADLGEKSHDVTGYPLRGTHALLACEDCHGTERTPLSSGGSGCADCHGDDDAHRSMLGGQCDDCHTVVSWLRTDFRHGVTGWPLRGAHRLAYCEDCHATSYAGTPTDCWRCHEAEAPRGEPAHRSTFFPQCDLCHRPYTWNALPTSSTGR
jgi:hypothetical protein